jgi:Ser/Thr protein kinase RdoA (MazF antagonist)
VAGFGRLCGEMDLALAGFDHPGLERTLQWDARHASALISHLLPVIKDERQRALIAAATEQAERRLQPLLDTLPVQAIHMDITDDNAVWARDAGRHWQLQGVIDFGDLVRTWRITDLSVTCAALLHHAGGDPFVILPAVQAYHAVNPLQHEELQALWPLIVARAAVLVLSGEQQVSIDPSNTYSRDNLSHEWEIFRVATSVPLALMEAAILTAVGHALPAIDSEGFAPLLPGLVGREFALIDLGV